MAPRSMDFRDFFSELFTHPLTALLKVSEMMWRNLGSHFWTITILVLLFVVIRYGLQRMHDEVSVRAALSERGRRRQRRKARQTIVASILTLLMWVSFTLMILAQLGLHFSPMTASWMIGSLSLATAFALRSYIADAMAGLRVVFTDRYGVGDYLDAETNLAGIVEHIGLWTTTLRGSDGTVWVLRNAEMNRVGNKTQSAPRLLTDVVLTKHDESAVTPEDVVSFERTATETLVALRSVLRDVRSIARDEAEVSEVSVEGVASVVPALAPNLSSRELDTVRGVDAETSGVIPLLSTALNQAPAGATPVFRDIEMLGLVTSTTTSVTIRIRVILDDPRGRSYGLILLRRKLFEAFSERGVATGFQGVDEGEFIN